MKNNLLLILLVGVLVVPMESSHATSPNAVIIFGQVSNSVGYTFNIKMYAINNTTQYSYFSSWHGAITHKDNSSLLQYACFDVQGNMFTNTIFNFAGNITKSSDPSTIGKPISITADTSTGNTTLVFGYSNYTGIENVIIK